MTNDQFNPLRSMVNPLSSTSVIFNLLRFTGPKYLRSRDCRDPLKSTYGYEFLSVFEDVPLMGIIAKQLLVDGGFNRVLFKTLSILYVELCVCENAYKSA